MKHYTVIGIMSGTSCDGLDIALCRFSSHQGKYSFKILQTTTLPYAAAWRKKLQNTDISAEALICLHKEYGKYIGSCINSFRKKYPRKVDFIASHGHTFFHNPAKRYTFQLGDGFSIAAETKLTTVSDFRSLDVALGGQGAPLVPIGDRMLFSQYGFCLNLGGIANVSFTYKKKTIAYDICPCNIIINTLCSEIGLEFDKNGNRARRGKIHSPLLTKLNAVAYYKKAPPKSLDKSQVLDTFMPIIKAYKISVEDKLRTVYEHIAMQITASIHANKPSTLYITGGGAFNEFLIDIICNKTIHTVVLPDPVIINHKEALLFAFLGVLRMENKNNCLASVTGAQRDNCGGVVNEM